MHRSIDQLLRYSSKHSAYMRVNEHTYSRSCPLSPRRHRDSQLHNIHTHMSETCNTDYASFNRPTFEIQQQTQRVHAHERAHVQRFMSALASTAQGLATAQHTHTYERNLQHGLCIVQSTNF